MVYSYSYIDYLSKRLTLSLLITFLSIIYITIVIYYIPVPEDIKKELSGTLLRVREVLAEISDPLDKFIFILKEELRMVLYVVTPLIGAMVYVWVLTLSAWGITVEALYQGKQINIAVLESIYNPLIFLEILSYSLLLVGSSNIVFDIIVRRSKDVKMVLYHIFTIVIALTMLIMLIAIMVVI